VRLVQTVTEPEWDGVTRGAALALEQYESSQCPCGCGFPAAVSQAADADARFAVGPPVRCHARTALEVAKVGYNDAQQPSALLFGVEEREVGRG